MRELTADEVDQVEGGILAQIIYVIGGMWMGYEIYKEFFGNDRNKNPTVEMGEVKIISEGCIRASHSGADGSSTQVEVNCAAPPAAPASGPDGP
jgi:hypothetical protein